MITTVARAVRSIFPGVMLNQVIAKVRQEFIIHWQIINGYLWVTLFNVIMGD